jgi:DNA-binding NtrC family response regulator
MNQSESQNRVLLVDDEAEFLQSMARALRRRGFAVETAQNGYHALKWLKLAPFDVVILDVKMPGIDGEEVFHRIHDEWPSLLVIMLTGHGTTEQAFKTSKKGVFDYLAKPCDIDKLTERIRAAIHIKSKDEADNQEKSLPDEIRVLLIDDEEELLYSLSKVLSRRNMRIFTAANGYKALEILNKQNVSVAVLDIKMPGIDGLELLPQMKKQQPNLQVIILTGHPTIDTAFKGSKSGAFEYMTKPPDVDSLTALIQKAFEKSQLQTEQEREKIIQEIKERYPD